MYLRTPGPCSSIPVSDPRENPVQYRGHRPISSYFEFTSEMDGVLKREREAVLINLGFPFIILVQSQVLGGKKSIHAAAIAKREVFDFWDIKIWGTCFLQTKLI